jgi:hypothetical protein
MMNMAQQLMLLECFEEIVAEQERIEEQDARILQSLSVEYYESFSDEQHRFFEMRDLGLQGQF